MARILLVHQPFDGGVGRHVRDIAAGVRGYGHEVITCGPRPPEGTPKDLPHISLGLVRAVAPRQDLACLARLMGIVRAVKPELIHAHSSKAGAIARLARMAHPQTPVLYTPHGYAFSGYFTSHVARSVYRGVERVLTPFASAIICVCEAEARSARSVGAGDRARVIYNGVDPYPVVDPDPVLVELARRGPIVGALSQLRPGKGLETLIDAVPLVLANHPSVQFVISGDGPEMAHLVRRARDRRVEHAVHFSGSTPAALRTLAGMGTFVHPSWAESFPYVVLEAMSLSKPIVASAVGGIPEMLANGVSGTLVAPGDHRSLARAIATLIGDQDQRRRVGAAAQARLKDRFARADMIRCLADLYDEVSRPQAPRT